MTPRRLFLTFAGLTALIGFIPACTEDGAGDGGSDSDKPTVALIMKSLANEFFQTMRDGAETHQGENADTYSLISNGIANETDLSAQVNLVEQMISRKVDAIVIAPADSQALVPALKKAQQAGITVVNIDNKLDDEILKEVDVTIPFVGPDNRAGARSVGEALVTSMKAGDQVAILEGVSTTFNAQQRLAGFKDAMEAAGMEVVSVQSADWETEKAQSVASAMVSEFPELKAILASNDSMAIGAVAAVQAAGKTGDIKVVGFDNISAVQEMLANGTILATADQHADKLAVFGIEAALQILSGEAAPEDQETPVDVVTGAP